MPRYYPIDLVPVLTPAQLELLPPDERQLLADLGVDMALDHRRTAAWRSVGNLLHSIAAANLEEV